MPKEKHYTIKSHKQEYRCKILEYGLYDKLFFGGTARCIVVTIHHEDHIAHIDAAGWHAYCNKSGSFPRAQHGTIDMIKSCVQFVFQKYKLINSVTLIDDSKITCHDGDIIELSAHYIIKYGKTWYERHFGAELENPNDAKKYDKFLQALQSHPIPFTFKEFTQQYLRPPLKQKRREALLRLLKPHYENAQSLLDFLQTINNEYDCSIFHIWLFRFMCHYANLDFGKVYWSIKRPNFHWKIGVVREKGDAFNWTQFGGIPSYIALRLGLDLPANYKYFD